MPSPPQYFGHDANINKFSPFDYESIQEVVMNKIDAQNIPKLIEHDHAFILDVRSVNEL